MEEDIRKVIEQIVKAVEDNHEEFKRERAVIYMKMRQANRIVEERYHATMDEIKKLDGSMMLVYEAVVRAGIAVPMADETADAEAPPGPGGGPPPAGDAT